MIGAVVTRVLSGVLIASGSVTPTAESFALEGFTHVVFAGSGTLSIREGATESFTVTADATLLTNLHTTVSGGRLTLSGLSATTARVDISGSGSVIYTGNSATATQHISGCGSITKG